MLVTANLRQNKTMGLLKFFLGPEDDFDPTVPVAWMSNHRFLGVQICFCYLILLYVGQNMMKSRKALNLKLPLATWNLLLAVFSTVGTIKISSEFLSKFRLQGFHGSFCKATGLYGGTSGYWVWLFLWSKAIELGDSFFLVFRKCPVTFLHWFHHSATLIYTFLGYADNGGAVRWGVTMNFAVHSMMYSYFFLRAVDVKVPGIIRKLITFIQIFQFVIGTYMCAYVAHDMFFGENNCDSAPVTTVLGVLLYASHMMLFMKFFYNAYILKKPKTRLE